MRILFLVRGLNVGGAQRQLVALARGIRRVGHEVSVATFYGGGLFEEELRADGIPIHDLGRSGRWDTVRSMARLVRLVRAERPDILHGYMGLANLYAALSRPFVPSVKVVWGVRSAFEDLKAYGLMSRFGDRLGRAVSPLADAIVANSEAARRRSVATGIPDRKIVVIPNGIDCDAFRPDEDGRRRLRQEWAVPADAPLVGVVARLDPVKGHSTFLRAASRIASLRPEVRFVCVGEGQPAYRQRLARLASEIGLGDRVVWAGERRVTSAVYSAFDVAVLPSGVGESFPNVVAEAMACGKACVVTESGDSPLIVGDTGEVAPPGDPEALARAVLHALERTRADAGGTAARARDRIVQEFSVERLVRRTERALEQVKGGS